jgi:hypothetical protein
LALTELVKEPRANTLVRLKSTVRALSAVNPAGFAAGASVTPPEEGRYTPPKAIERALAVFQ